MTLKIAVAGKGGSGKSTLSALLCRSLCDRGIRPVLAVDADPNSCLPAKLGLYVERTIGQLREELRQDPEAKPAGVGKSEWIERMIHEAVVESVGLDILAMGRQEGPGCYCYINNLLRESLEQISEQYQAVVIDNEAGMEHLSRRSNGKMDVLLVVAQPTLVGARTVGRIMELVRSLRLEVGRSWLVLNRCEQPPEGPLWEEFTRSGIEWLGCIPEDPRIEEWDAMNRSIMILPADAKALVATGTLLWRVLERRTT